MFLCLWLLHPNSYSQGRAPSHSLFIPWDTPFAREQGGSGSPNPSACWLCSYFLERSRMCPIAQFPVSQTPAALAYTISICRHLGVAGGPCPLTQSETLGAGKEASSVSFSSFPLVFKPGQQAVFKGRLPSPAHPSPPPGWPQVPVQVEVQILPPLNPGRPCRLGRWRPGPQAKPSDWGRDVDRHLSSAAPGGLGEQDVGVQEADGMGIPPSTAPQEDQIILSGWGWMSTPHPLLPKHSQIASVVPATHGLAWPSPLWIYSHSLQLPTPPLPQPRSPSLALKSLRVTPWPPVAGASMVT